jgi:hypothetical protein
MVSNIMYFADLTGYSYYLKRPIESARNIGWLDAAHPFARAPVERLMFEKLCDICASTEPANVHVNKLRSVQSCPICGSDNFVIPGCNEELLVGMSELWIPKSKGEYLVAPSLILHFIADHQYSPPQSFWDAVKQFDLSAPYSGQEAYLKAVAGAF